MKKRTAIKYREKWGTLFLRIPIEQREEIDRLAESTGLNVSEMFRPVIEKTISEIQNSMKKADTGSIG